MGISGRVGFSALALFLLAFSAFFSFFPGRVKASFKEVPEKGRPGWSSMPSWYIRLLGLFFAMAAGVAVYMFFARD